MKPDDFQSCTKNGIDPQYVQEKNWERAEQTQSEAHICHTDDIETFTLGLLQESIKGCLPPFDHYV